MNSIVQNLNYLGFTPTGTCPSLYHVLQHPLEFFGSWDLGRPDASERQGQKSQKFIQPLLSPTYLDEPSIRRSVNRPGAYLVSDGLLQPLISGTSER